MKSKKLSIILFLISAFFLLAPDFALAGSCNCLIQPNPEKWYCVKGENITEDVCKQANQAGTNWVEKYLANIPNVALQTCFYFQTNDCQAAQQINQKADQPKETPIEPIVPTLQINIPTVQFSKISREGQLLGIPFLAEYISGIYKYAVAIVSIIAIVMIMVGGLRWLTAGGNASAIGGAKEMISGAVIGLFLVLGSYTVLYTVNPDLVNFKNLQIKLIEKQTIGYLNILSDSEYGRITGESNPGKEKIVQMAKQIAQKVGIPDPCMFVAIVTKESGGNPGVIGEDENFQGPKYVWSRRDFLMSGKKYSCAQNNICNENTTFTPPFTRKEDYKPEVHNKLPIKNDDKFNINKPPDYGLDWRFSHGFGLGQMTLRQPSPEIPKLLTIEYTLQKSAQLFKSNLKCATDYNYQGEDNLRAAYVAYGMGCGNLQKIKDRQKYLYNRPATIRAMEHYNRCKSQAAAVAPSPDPNDGEAEE